jgi:hypothetical protein
MARWRKFWGQGCLFRPFVDICCVKSWRATGVARSKTVQTAGFYAINGESNAGDNIAYNAAGRAEVGNRLVSLPLSQHMFPHGHISFHPSQTERGTLRETRYRIFSYGCCCYPSL